MKCSIIDCEKTATSRTFCNHHYYKWRYYGDPVFVRQIKTCEVDGCDARRKARGMCGKHDNRLRKWGDVNFVPKRRGCPANFPTRVVNNEERFWSLVVKGDQCWIWAGLLSKQGYGMWSMKGKNVRAHRYAFFLANGRYAYPMTLHSCDVKACVNPDHLREGTHRDNTNDAMLRKRMSAGERHHWAKLTEADVVIIRESRDTKANLARHFNVSKSAITSILCYKTWRHLDEGSQTQVAT